MAWTDGVTRATGDIVTSGDWNNYLGAAGSVMQLKSHAHGGTTGEGSQSLGPLVLEDFTDAAAPAAPGAGKTRVFTVSGKPQYRAGAAGAARVIITDEITASGDLAGTYPSPTVAKITLGSDADGDIYYRASSVLARLAKGTALQILRMNAGATAPEWATGGNVTVLDKKVNDTTVNNSAAETAVYSKSITGGSLGATGGVRLKASGNFLNNTGGAQSVTIKVKFGGGVLFTRTSFSLGAGSATRVYWSIDLLMLNVTASSQRAWSRWVGNAVASGIGWQAGEYQEGYGTLAIDSSSSNNLDITATLSAANVNLEAKCETALLEQV